MSESSFTADGASADLLHRYQQGDSQAAEAIFERYADRLTRLARSRLAAKLASRVDPEDIVMSAYRSFFVAARDGRFEVNRGGDLWRLLVQVTLHKLYRQVERQQADRRSVDREEPAVGDTGADPRLLAREPTPDEVAIAAETLEGVLAAIPERGRAAIELRLAGYEQSEIASRLGCSERTVRRWLDQARQSLATRGGEGFVAVKPRKAERPMSLRPVIHAPLPAIQLECPLAWGDFTLQQQIGAGATGKVYRALCRHDGREVAVKFLRKALVRERRVVEQFLHEARIVADLKHPGIVAIEGIGHTPGRGLFLVMELVRGCNLAEVRKGQQIQPQQAAAWVATAARTVQFAHERGVIHCDLKPGNLLLDETGAIRVTDFGLAVQSTTDRGSGLLAGTPAFMAPEQVDRCWGPISPQTDVYGLGAVLYFLLFGTPPHAGSTVADVLARVVRATPVEFPQHLAEEFSRLEETLRRSLAKVPAERPRSCADLASMLSQP